MALVYAHIGELNSWQKEKCWPRIKGMYSLQDVSYTCFVLFQIVRINSSVADTS